MAYPLSSDVSPGDATLANQYNYLRSDSLRFGQAAADAANIGAVLENFESRLTIEKLNIAQLRVPASVSQPVSLIVHGYPVQSVANVDLDAGDVPTGGASVWYIFANRTASSTSFTLSISTSPTPNANQRLIGRFYYDGSKIEKDSVRTEFSIHISELLFLKENHICNGRLTLSTGVPITTSDIGSSSTLYFTPINGNLISLYVPNYGWRIYSFSELTLDLSALDADKNYDIFIYDNEGTLTLQSLAWSSDTLRATSLLLHDGIYCKSSDLTCRYLGTIRTLAAGGATADTECKRFVWNLYNRFKRVISKYEPTASWTYSTEAWRPLHNDTDNRIEFVKGLDLDPITLHAWVFGINDSSGGFSIGVALDAIDITDADLRTYCSVDHITVECIYLKNIALGYHYLQITEWAEEVGITTFCGEGSGVADECVQIGGLGCLIN